MSEPRRHHFIPRLLQRRFTDGQGRLFVFDKRRPEAVFNATPSDVFVKRDLNTIFGKDGSRDVGLERWYSTIESEVAPVIERIIDRARARKTPRLTPDERNIWDNFLYHQQKRAPDAFERLGLVESFEKELPLWIKEYEREVRPLTDQERADLWSTEGKKRLIQGASVQARGRGSRAIIEMLASRGIVVAIIAAPNKSFILGDHPLARMGVDGHLTATELWFPISADVAVSPGGSAMAEKLIDLGGSEVRHINEVIFQQSNAVASRSEALLRSLARL
jgi:hypothetical protein